MNLNYTPVPSREPANPLNTAGVKSSSAALHKQVRNRDKRDIMELLITHTNEQRQQIRRQYKLDYGRDPFDDLKKFIHSDLQDLAVSLLTPPMELICKHLNKAMTGFITNEKTLVELLIPRTNKEIHEIVEIYEQMYGRPLVEHMCSTTSKHFRRLLTLIMTAERDERDKVSTSRARCLASELYAAGEAARRGTNQTAFNRIMSRESFAQLRLVFDEYEQLSGGNTMEEAISTGMTGDLFDGITAIVECVRYIPGFFSGCLFRALKGWTIDQTALTRILVMRSEIDMVNIKESFQRIYNKDLKNEIKVATSGDYRCALLKLLDPKSKN